MNGKLSPKDWLRISAYLDQELSSRERDRLEKRLAVELDLANALADLRQTRALLHHLPQLRAPRNFTLEPHQVGQRQRAPAYPALRLVTVLASIVFIILFAGDLFIQRSVPVAAPAQLMSAMEAETITTAEVQADAVMESPAALEAAPIAAPAEPEATPYPGAVMQFSAPEPPSEAYPEPLAKQAPQPSTLSSGEVALQDEAQAARIAQEPETIDRPRIFGVEQRLWRVAEILAAIIALVAGLGWLLTRRRI
jgi:hypothetical protein